MTSGQKKTTKEGYIDFLYKHIMLTYSNQNIYMVLLIYGANLNVAIDLYGWL